LRLAILADIHGNLPAFEAALKHVASHKVDQIIIAGDIIIGSPDSDDCWKLARSLGCPILRGNHERYAAHYGTFNAPNEWATEQYAPLHWAVAQLAEQDRQAMAQLPESLRLPDAPNLFIVHATERSDNDTIESHTPDELLPTMFPHTQERFIVRAHNHLGQVRLWDDRLIITGGSVGLALDGNPTAQYLLLDSSTRGWQIQHQSVPYNLNTTIARFYDTGYLSSSGPIGRLYFREVVTASQQIVPFLRLYAQWSKKDAISLSQAVGKFLSDY
jgi:predicted phosphodiesterase